MKRTQRHAPGSLCFDKRRGQWQYFWYENGRRRSRVIGSRSEYPTKAAAWKAVESCRPQAQETPRGETMAAVIQRYENERMPSRYSTARVYRSFLNNHILPQWGDTLIRDVQPRPVELWLRQLPLSPKSKSHVRSLLHSLVDFAMWAGLLESDAIQFPLCRTTELHGAPGRRAVSRRSSFTLAKRTDMSLSQQWLCCACVSGCASVRHSRSSGGM